MDMIDSFAVAPALEGYPSRHALVIRMGRGRTGGTTILDVIIQWARVAGRKVVVADGDLRNSTLSSLYPPESEGGAMKPHSDDLVDMKDLFTSALGKAVEERASLVVDFGGGDRVMLEYGREVSLVAMAEGLGMRPVALYVTGPERDDFEHILSLWNSNVFRPDRSLLVLNEHLVPSGRSPQGAFRDVLGRPEIERMADEGLRVVVMPRLPSMSQVREAGLSLIDAMQGKPGNKGVPLDPVRAFMVKAWFRSLETAFAQVEALEWLP
jgi:hypothetical protein